MHAHSISNFIGSKIELDLIACGSIAINFFDLIYTNEKFNTVFIFRAAQRSDAGMYYVEVIYGNESSDPFTFTLEYDKQPDLIELITILFSILGALIVISTLALIVWYKWIRILLFIRRHMGKYDEGL